MKLSTDTLKVSPNVHAYALSQFKTLAETTAHDWAEILSFLLEERQGKWLVKNPEVRLHRNFISQDPDFWYLLWLMNRDILAEYSIHYRIYIPSQLGLKP